MTAMAGPPTLFLTSRCFVTAKELVAVRSLLAPLDVRSTVIASTRFQSRSRGSQPREYTRLYRAWIVTLIALSSLLVATSSVSAHEEYVVDEEQDVGLVEFLTEALTDPFVVGPLLGGAVATLAVLGGYLAIRPLQQDIGVFRFAMREYSDYVPWLLRISLGIPLIGAGFSGYFISPALEVDLRLLQVGLGFLLLFGFATRLVALVGLATYLVGVAIWPTLLLQLEFIGGFAALALIGSGRPSADHVLQRIAGTRGTVYRKLDPVHDWADAFQSRIDPTSGCSRQSYDSASVPRSSSSG